MMDAALRSSFKRLFDYTITWFLVLDYTNALMNKMPIGYFLEKGLCSSQKLGEDAKSEATTHDITSFISLSCKALNWIT
ncbi:hypothetical protein CK203_063452 [Vitis vinifera]|uniref:Uncharacterized protein n=1 Tax=Vitis vinifera TaxID=29760 RepID=A0A438FQW4_VITVI|nr:hypothetical protein CK203_063452 [Vitis vinifera]